MTWVIHIFTVEVMATLGAIATILLGYEAIVETATQKRSVFCRENMIVWAIGLYVIGYAYTAIATPDVLVIQQIFRLLNFNLFVGLIGSQLVTISEVNAVVFPWLKRYVGRLRNAINSRLHSRHHKRS